MSGMTCEGMMRVGQSRESNFLHFRPAVVALASGDRGLEGPGSLAEVSGFLHGRATPSRIPPKGIKPSARTVMAPA
jgi:hypothetical protein